MDAVATSVASRARRVGWRGFLRGHPTIAAGTAISPSHATPKASGRSDESSSRHPASHHAAAPAAASSSHAAIISTGRPASHPPQLK